MEEEIILVKPTMEYKDQAINLIDEVEEVDLDEKIRYSGFASLEKYKDDYEGWLENITELEEREKAYEKGLVPQNVFFSVRKSDNKVVGIISVRRELNDFLFNYGGHIGYSVLPSERRKGYAYKQLVLALDFCKSIGINPVLIACLDYNIGSSKTIEKAGGVLDNIVTGEKCGEKVLKKRYWINL